MSKATVKDIAASLNLSTDTVYRALNNTGRVSEKTKKRVIEYAAQVGYHPNVSAQGLAKRKKYRIVFLYVKTYSEWWSSIRAGAEIAAKELSEFGVEVTFLEYFTIEASSVGASLAREPIGLLDIIERGEVDGIILVPSIHHEILAALELAKQKGIPVVCINADASLTSQRLFYYGPNEEQVGQIAGELMGKLLQRKGNIALIGVEYQDFYRHATRKKGFFNRLYRNYPEINVIQQCSLPPQYVQTYLQEMLENIGHDLSAIYVYESTILAETARCVKNLGLSNIIIVGHECLSGCRELMHEGWIHATLCQETFSQGFYPLKLLYNYLLTGAKPKTHYYSNVNIVFESNLDLLDCNENGCGFQ